MDDCFVENSAVWIHSTIPTKCIVQHFFGIITPLLGVVVRVGYTRVATKRRLCPKEREIDHGYRKITQQTGVRIGRARWMDEFSNESARLGFFSQSLFKYQEQWTYRFDSPTFLNNFVQITSENIHVSADKVSRANKWSFYAGPLPVAVSTH